MITAVVVSPEAMACLLDTPSAAACSKLTELLACDRVRRAMLAGKDAEGLKAVIASTVENPAHSVYE